MLSENKLTQLKNLVTEYSRDEIIWAKGYLAGILEQKVSTKNEEVAATPSKIKPTIIYATETGNSKKLALQLQALLKKNKIQTKISDAFQYSLDKIEKEEFLILIVSTQGDGEPPINAIKFFDNLDNLTVNLSKTKFAVLGLGNSSYPLFCKTGEVIDEKLSQLGAQRVLELQKADVDYAPVAEKWFEELIKIIQNAPGAKATDTKKSSEVISLSQRKTYTGVIKHKIVLNDRESNKQTYHIEIVSEDDHISYEPGDAIGFYPKNDINQINEILSFFNPEDQEKTELLVDKNIKGLTKSTLKSFSSLFNTEIEDEKIDLLDILKKYPKPKEVSIEEINALLHPIAPRLYSISSSLEAHEGEVHITVKLDTFTANGEQKLGLCSSFLANYPTDTPIEFYIHKNKNFRLPEDENKDIIMIGPGTGIAPFRSFLYHRDATGAEGKNWLFFGEQYFICDFYYQTEIQEWLSSGVLTKLDTAFSRDQKEKIYVQDRLKEKAKEVFEWIENGAYLYVCGQRSPMGVDVEETLAEIIANHKNIPLPEAKAILEQMELEGRYQKDVY